MDILDGGYKMSTAVADYSNYKTVHFWYAHTSHNMFYICLPLFWELTWHRNSASTTVVVVIATLLLLPSPYMYQRLEEKTGIAVELPANAHLMLYKNSYLALRLCNNYQLVLAVRPETCWKQQKYHQYCSGSTFNNYKFTTSVVPHKFTASVVPHKFTAWVVPHIFTASVVQPSLSVR